MDDLFQQSCDRLEKAFRLVNVDFVIDSDWSVLNEINSYRFRWHIIK